MTLSHYTLNTGDLRYSPRGEVTEHTIRCLDPLVKAGGGWVPAGNGTALGFRIGFHHEDGLLFCLAFEMPGKGKNTTFATAILAWGEDSAREGWARIHGIARRMNVTVAAGPMPAAMPLLAVLLQPEAAAIPPDVLAASADLERCIAWTVLGQEGLAP